MREIVTGYALNGVADDHAIGGDKMEIELLYTLNRSSVDFFHIRAIIACGYSGDREVFSVL